MQIQSENLFDSLERKDLFGILAIVVLKTFIRDFYQRFDDIDEVLVTVFRTLCKNGIHCFVKDLNISLSLLNLLFLGETISVIVHCVVL